MTKLGQPILQTSLKKFLSDTAISVLLFVILVVSHHKFQAIVLEVFRAAELKSLDILLALMIGLLAYPLGLFINGTSFLSLFWLVLREEKKIFEKKMVH